MRENKGFRELYGESRGFRVFSDNSHTEAIEVGETEPFWIAEVKKGNKK